MAGCPLREAAATHHETPRGTRIGASWGSTGRFISDLFHWYFTAAGPRAYTLHCHLTTLNCGKSWDFTFEAVGEADE